MPSDIQELQRAFDMNVKAIDEAYDRTAKRSHLSPSSFDILYTLFAYGDGCTQKELCERCYDGKQTVNSAVHKMQRDGLLQISAGTGRNTHVHLTDAGRAYAARAIAPVLEAEHAVLESFDEDERELLSRVIDVYTRRLVQALDGIESV